MTKNRGSEKFPKFGCFYAFLDKSGVDGWPASDKKRQKPAQKWLFCAGLWHLFELFFRFFAECRLKKAERFLKRAVLFSKKAQLFFQGVEPGNWRIGLWC